MSLDHTRLFNLQILVVGVPIRIERCLKPLLSDRKVGDFIYFLELSHIVDALILSVYDILQHFGL